RTHQEARIIVTGCAAAIAPERYAAMPEVDQVLDNRAKLSAQSYSPVEPPQPNLGESAAHLVDGFEGKSRAFLQVQQGCDHRCTFCIIPYARGPSRSVPIGAIAEQARGLVEAGCREIVLTGVDLTAYGADLPGRPSLGQMARRLLAAVPELSRLRLSSLDPVEIDDELWRLFGDEARLMPHLHLSLQAGDDLILKRMKRRHSRADAIAVACRARLLRPEAALGADLIAGFPTESEAMFANSLDLVAECGLAFVHVFPYSARPGTPAARMPQLPGDVVRERAARLRAAGQTALACELRARIGSETEVLIERAGLGRAAFYARVAFTGVGEAGRVQRMRLVGSDGAQLVGAPVP
ncbi:MAG: MiaB/RimO family radical SAM methylthiotransferase, partial [Stellaceae bacterium]